MVTKKTSVKTFERRFKHRPTRALKLQLAREASAKNAITAIKKVLNRREKR